MSSELASAPSTNRISLAGTSMSISMADFSLAASDESSVQSRPTNGNGAKDEERLARRETKAVHRLRLAVFLVLACTAAVVCALAYRLTSTNEQNDFETAFGEQANRVIDAFQINALRRVRAIESLALSITSHAKFTNSTWPLVTLPDFERRGRDTSELAEVMSLMMVPFVTDETRKDWESYSVANQGWIEAGLQVQAQIEEENRAEGEELEQHTDEEQSGVDGSRRQLRLRPIPPEIYRLNGLKPAEELGPGPYLPQWQVAPAVPVSSLVNFNLLSHTGYHDSLMALLTAKVAVVGRSFEFKDPGDVEAAGRREVFDYFLKHWLQGDNVYEEDPVADVHVPLYGDYDRSTRTLVGLLTCVVYWRTYFVNILPENAIGVVVVLENTCDQRYTYQINGPEVLYAGSGDRHDNKYDALGIGTMSGAYLQANNEARNINGSCLYRINVYPSQEMEDLYLSRAPALYTTVLVLIFLFTSSVFVCYDCIVERRQRVVMDTAVASSAIVSSLFPKTVRERLYNQDSVHGSGITLAKPSGKTSGKATDTMRTKGRPPVAASTMTTSQRDIQNFLNESTNSADSGAKPANETATVGGVTAATTRSKPIADSFQDCTVLFADIVGFTSWSSGREPTDVFVLLETLYGAFDKIAKQRRVFKVETIGDCYLAVTGLPEPQADHAIKMSLFAYGCLRKMRSLMAKELRDLLGGETGLLGMRFGLHSGPVTAGVLRGEKSRFQLFGDTVNTAARMESTGMRDRIQLSEATAGLIQAAGKGRWLEPRKETVQAKGKGELKTFWLNPRKRKRLGGVSARALDVPDVPEVRGELARKSTGELPTVPDDGSDEVEDDDDDYDSTEGYLDDEGADDDNSDTAVDLEKALSVEMLANEAETERRRDLEQPLSTNVSIEKEQSMPDSFIYG